MSVYRPYNVGIKTSPTKNFHVANTSRPDILTDDPARASTKHNQGQCLVSPLLLSFSVSLTSSFSCANHLGDNGNWKVENSTTRYTKRCEQRFRSRFMRFFFPTYPGKDSKPQTTKTRIRWSSKKKVRHSRRLISGT